MDNKIMDTLETLEEKIENIKWLITAPFPIKRWGVPVVLDVIRRSAGILGKNSPKGTLFENRSRRAWKANFNRRVAC